MNDMTALMNGRSRELVAMAEEVLKTLNREVEEKGLKLSITDGGKEGKIEAITSCKYVEERFQECSKNELFWRSAT